jgi:hypothetical protein
MGFGGTSDLASVKIGSLACDIQTRYNNNIDCLINNGDNSGDSAPFTGSNGIRYIKYNTLNKGFDIPAKFREAVTKS